MKPPPLGKWLASRNPANHTRAQEYLNHLGSHDSDALYAEWKKGKKGKQSPIEVFSSCIVGSILSCLIMVFLPPPNRYLWGFFVGIGPTIVAFQIQVFYQHFYVRRPRMTALASELAQRTPFRALEPLLDSWLSSKTNTPDGLKTAQTLVYLLGESMQNRTWQLNTVWRKRIQNALNGNPTTRICLIGNIKRLPELTDEEADLVLVFLQCLARSGQPHERAFLAQIVAQPAELPNRQFIREAAAAFVAPTSPIPETTLQQGYTMTAAAAQPTVISASQRP